ncbi:MAG: tryptophan synthase subunit alpha [Actinomycetota bacterium]
MTAASHSGVAGLITPDLPIEEAREITRALNDKQIAHVQMVAPTTSERRAATLAKASTGFVYAVSRLGVTGTQDSLAEAASDVVERIRPHASVPILLGIGITDGEQAFEAAKSADGVIVGSAIMRRVLDDDTDAAVGLARELRASLSRHDS